MVENARGMYDTWYGHQLISYPLFIQWHTECDDGENQNNTCINLMNEMSSQVGNIYPYGLDWPNCDDSNSLYSFKLNKWFMEKVIQNMFHRNMPFFDFQHSKQDSKRILRML